MKSNQLKQYVVRGIPKSVDMAIRKKARRQNKSLNSVLLESIIQGSGVKPALETHHDLDFLIGTMTAAEAEELNATIQENRRIEPGDW